MKLKREKGITLIALAITIVVLIILAGITIGAITGDNGIINQTKNAKDDTQYAQWEEKIDVAIIDAENKNRNTTMDDVIDELIDKKVINDESQVDKDTGTITTNEPSYVFEDKLIDYIEVFTANKLKAGEYVYYVDATGTTRKCIVLWDESSGYGTQIITQDIVGNVTFGSKTITEAAKEYNDAIAILNNEAMAYLNTTYASDARCVGSVPDNKNFDEAELSSYFTYAFEGNNVQLKDSDENYILDNTQMEKLGIKELDTEYFLASRYITVFGYGTDLRIRLNCSKNIYEALIAITIMSMGSGENSSVIESGLRPVFTLKNEVKITGGEGTEENPYTLGI